MNLHHGRARIARRLATAVIAASLVAGIAEPTAGAAPRRTETRASRLTSLSSPRPSSAKVVEALCSEISPSVHTFPRIVVVPPRHGDGKVYVTPSGVAGTNGATAAKCVRALPLRRPRHLHTVSPVTPVRPGAAKCSPEFQKLWDEALAGKAFSVALSPVASFAVAKAVAAGKCSSTATFRVSEATGTLFDELSVSGMTATVSMKEICLKAASFQLPSSWKIPALELPAHQSFCILLPLLSQEPGVIGQLDFRGLPVLRYGGLTGGATDLKFAGDLLKVAASATGPDHLSASMTGSISTKGTYALATTLGGDLFAAVDGTLTGNLVGNTKSLTYSLTGKLATPIALGPVLHVTALSATLANTGPGLSFTGEATVGTSSTAAIDLSGSATSADNWSLAVSAGSTSSSWVPIKGLRLKPKLSGTLKDANGVVTFDVSAKGTASAPLASWAPTSGVSVSVVSITASNGAAPSVCALSKAGDAWLEITGSISIDKLAVQQSACIDLLTDAWKLQGTAANLTVIPQVSLTKVVLTASEASPKSSPSITGSATASFNVGDTSDTSKAGRAAHTFPVKLALDDGAFVIGGTTDLSAWGIGGSPVNGFAAWASAAVTAYNTGDPNIGNHGVVALPAGLSAQATITLGSTTANLLTKVLHFTLPAGDSIMVMASLGTGGSFTFTASLKPPSSFPLLELPGGVALGATSVTISNGAISVTSDATIQGGAAAVHLSLAIAKNGSFKGKASVTDLSILGTSLDLSGVVSGTAGGGISTEVKATDAGPINVAPGLVLKGLSLTLGTSGLAISGTADIGPSSQTVDMSISGTLTNLENWSLKIDTASPIVWNPSPVFSLDVLLKGTISSTNGKVTFSVTASPPSGVSALGTLTFGPLQMSLASLGVGDSKAPAGCSVAAGDLWLEIAGSASVTVVGQTYSFSPSGCFDLSNGDVDVSLGTASAGFSDGAWGVTVNLNSLDISGNLGSALAVSGSGSFSVSTPLASFSGTVSVSVDGSGNILAGGSISLPAPLNIGASTEVWYTSQAISNFKTGDGTVNLPEGLTILESYPLPSGALSILQNLGISLPAQSAITMMGSLNPSTGTITLKMVLSLGTTGATIFSTNGDSLALDSAFLQATISETNFVLSVGVTATLDLAPLASGEQSSQLLLNGAISLNLDDLSVEVSLGFTGTWNGALGIPGLVITSAEIQGGISADLIPSLGFAATITSFPTFIDEVTGIQPGATVSVAVNLDVDSPLVSISINGNGAVALEPLELAGPSVASLIQVDDASLYISPDGATIGSTTYPPGFSLNFVAQIVGTPVTIAASIDPNTLSMSFDASLGSFTAGPVSFGGANLAFALSTGSFNFAVSGSISDPSTGFAFDASMSLNTSGWALSASLSAGDPSFVAFSGTLSGYANSSGFELNGYGSLSLAGYQAVSAYFSCGTGVPFQAGISITGLGSVSIYLYDSGFTLDFYVGGSASGSIVAIPSVLNVGGSVSGYVDFHLSTQESTSFTWSVSVSAWIQTYGFQSTCYAIGIPYPCDWGPNSPSSIGSFSASGGWTIGGNQICVDIGYDGVGYNVCMPWSFS